MPHSRIRKTPQVIKTLASHRVVDRPQDDLVSEYQIVSQVAAGKSGLLYRAIRNDDGSEVEVFVVRSGDDDETRRIKKRISQASQLVHPAVARILGNKFDGDE